MTAAYAAAATAHARLIIVLNEQITELKVQVRAHFLGHLDAEVYLSMLGIGEIVGARVLAEFGDDPTHYASSKARKNYAGTSPITRASGKSYTVQARYYVRNNRLADALQTQAFSALRASADARGHYDKQRAREVSYNQPSASSATDSSASSTAASKPHPLRRSDHLVTTPIPMQFDTKRHGCLTALTRPPWAPCFTGPNHALCSIRYSVSIIFTGCTQRRTPEVRP